MKRTKLKKALCIILASLMMISASACQQNSTEETSTAQTTQTETSETKTDEVKTTETSTEAAEDNDPFCYERRADVQSDYSILV